MNNGGFELIESRYTTLRLYLMLLYCGCNQNYLSLAFINLYNLKLMSPLFNLVNKEHLVNISKNARGQWNFNFID